MPKLKGGADHSAAMDQAQHDCLLPVPEGIAAQDLQEKEVQSSGSEVDEPRYLYFQADKPPHAIPGMQAYEEEVGINEHVFGKFGVPSSSELILKNDALKAILAQERFQRMRVQYAQRRSNQHCAAMQQKLAKSASNVRQLTRQNDKLQDGLLEKSSDAQKLESKVRQLKDTLQCNQQAANDFVNEMEAEYEDRVQYLQGRLQDLSQEGDKQQAIDFLNEENELAKEIADQRRDQIELDAREANFTALKQRLTDIETRHTAAATQQGVAHDAETARLRQAAAEIETQLQAAKSEAASFRDQLAASEEQKAAREQQAAADLAQAAAGHDEQLRNEEQEAMSAQDQLARMQNSHAELNAEVDKQTALASASQASADSATKQLVGLQRQLETEHAKRAAAEQAHAVEVSDLRTALCNAESVKSALQAKLDKAEREAAAMQAELDATRKQEQSRKAQADAQSRKAQADAHSSLAAMQAVHKNSQQAAAAGPIRLGDAMQTSAGLQNTTTHSQTAEKLLSTALHHEARLVKPQADDNTDATIHNSFDASDNQHVQQPPHTPLAEVDLRNSANAGTGQQGMAREVATGCQPGRPSMSSPSTATPDVPAGGKHAAAGCDPKACTSATAGPPATAGKAAVSTKDSTSQGLKPVEVGSIKPAVMQLDDAGLQQANLSEFDVANTSTSVANTDELLAHQQQGDGQLAGVNVNPVEDGVRAMEGNHAAEGSRKRKAAEKGSDRPQPKRTKRDECSRPQHRCVCGTLACMGK